MELRGHLSAPKTILILSCLDLVVADFQSTSCAPARVRVRPTWLLSLVLPKGWFPQLVLLKTRVFERPTYAKFSFLS